MYMVEITEDKLSGLSEHVEKALSHMGKVMQCVSELGEEGISEMTERMGMRGSYRNRYNRPYREYDEYETMPYRSMGRYSRY